uniref:Complex 1 LYR protein domain-containing protein n=1 Tax=Oryzias sinensis TaxID=183150 RepID=A0A8C7YDL7_9TELE
MQSRTNLNLDGVQTAAGTRTLFMLLLLRMELPSLVFLCCRTYALRRVRDAFRANRKVEDPKSVERLMEEGRQALALIQRQVEERKKVLPRILI